MSIVLKETKQGIVEMKFMQEYFIECMLCNISDDQINKTLFFCRESSKSKNISYGHRKELARNRVDMM